METIHQTEIRGLTFKERYEAGEQVDIDDCIDHWHDSPDELGKLHEYLGMTWDEYKHWVMTGEIL